MIGNKEINLRFAAVMMGFVGVVFLTYREAVLGPLLTPLTMLTARATFALLQSSGIEVARFGAVISHPDGFAYEVYYRCTGFLPVAFLTVSILAYPGTLRRKIVGLALGMPILVGLNIIRLIHLFRIGVYHPATYDLAHKVLWEGFVILAVFGLWLGWRWWSDSESEGLVEAEANPEQVLKKERDVFRPSFGCAFFQETQKEPQ
jgi:exosortase H (IPTLxxWG-CTERM-specific)